MIGLNFLMWISKLLFSAKKKNKENLHHLYGILIMFWPIFMSNTLSLLIASIRVDVSIFTKDSFRAPEAISRPGA